MNDTKTIHETIIKDIIGVISDISNSEHLPGIFSNNSYRSVAQAAEKLTLVFPVFVTTDVPVENAVMVSRAIERKAVTMMQMLFSAISITDAKDAIDYVSRFHGNLDTDNLSVDDFIYGLEKIAANNESAIDKAKIKAATQALKESLNYINYELPDAINEVSLNDYKVFDRADGVIVSKVIQEAPIITRRMSTGDLRNLAAGTKDTNNIEKDRVFATDIRKANELVPTMMIINFFSSDFGTCVNAVIGIKAKLYPIDTKDAIDRIMLKNKDNQGLQNFIKATTREISFWKDFVFAIDKAKIDALSSAKRGSSSKIWKVLERRATTSTIKRFMGLSNDAAAISTLCISRDAAESLKKDYRIDVDKVSVIRPIMESYNLMCFSIIDESMETVKFIFDTGDDNYETLSFTHLEREAADGNYKKVINLMTKLAR